jgi:O-antigen ligase
MAPDLSTAAGLWKAYYIEPILFFLIFINSVKTGGDKKIILWSLGISTLVISILAIIQKFNGFGIAQPGWMNEATRRVTSIFTSPNAIGLYLGPIVSIYLGWILQNRKKYFENLIKILIIALAGLAILFAVSQGTYLGLMAGIIFLAWFGWDKKKTAILLLLCLVIIFATPNLRDKIWPTVTFRDASGQNRLILIEMSKNYLSANAKNFVFGAGIFGFSELQDQTRDPLKMEALLYPHNIFLNFWLDIGLVGLIGFIWLIVNFFYKGFKKITYENKWLTLGIMAAMVTIIIHGLVDVPYLKNDLAIIFWVIIGLLF